jgi:Ca2+-binding EF-hand superfamily protein
MGENFQNAFNAFDDDRDGWVPPALLEKLFHAVGFNPDPEEVEDVIEDSGLNPLTFESCYDLLSGYARSADPEGCSIKRGSEGCL